MTATILSWRKHKLHGPWCCVNQDNCMFCELTICMVCGGGEATLPTECPGMRLLPGQEDLIYIGQLDYVNGEWVTPESHPKHRRFWFIELGKFHNAVMRELSGKKADIFIVDELGDL